MKRYAGLLTSFVLLFSSTAVADTVEWIDGFGAPPVPAWTISPLSPTTADAIFFRGPVDQTYGNGCTAEAAFGGTPYLAVNHVTKTIELRFQGPHSGACTKEYRPVIGLEGNFGPLTPGNWVFRCLHNKIPFHIPFVVAGGGGGKKIYVDRDAPTIWPADGSTWLRAYRNLQDGLAAALPGDTIYVADGTYLPDVGGGKTSGDRTASFVIPDEVVVLCGYAGWGAPDPDARDVDLTSTILSGDLQGNDLWGILNIDENSYHVVSGVGAGTLDGAVITAGNADGQGDFAYGGGVFLHAASLVVSHCKIKDNKADFGGGVACLQGIVPVFIHTEITGNWANILGGCLYNEEANVELTNCLITGNTCGKADVLGSDAIFNVMGSLDINSCTIADNRPGHNQPANGRAIISLVWGPGFVDTLSIKNCILRNGGNEVWSSEPGIVTLHYNNIEGGAAGYAGGGNIDADPLFKNPGLFGIEGQWFFDDDGYTLQPGSPSIDAGNHAFLPLGLITDLDNNPRVLGPQIDQGSYEAFGLVPAVVAVPNVLGLTLTAAQTALTNANLVVGVVNELHHNTVPAGRVISQHPDAGATAEVGSAVQLTISKGPAVIQDWELVASFSVTLNVPSNPPSFPISTSGPGASNIDSPFPAEYKVEVEGVLEVGGAWQATPSTGTIPAGESTIEFTVTSQDIRIDSLPPGIQKVAEVKIYIRPLPL